MMMMSTHGLRWHGSKGMVMTNLWWWRQDGTPVAVFCLLYASL